jgi:hypothetical protein
MSNRCVPSLLLSLRSVAAALLPLSGKLQLMLMNATDPLPSGVARIDEASIDSAFLC